MYVWLSSSLSHERLQGRQRQDSSISSAAVSQSVDRSVIEQGNGCATKRDSVVIIGRMWVRSVTRRRRRDLCTLVLCCGAHYHWHAWRWGAQVAMVKWLCSMLECRIERFNCFKTVVVVFCCYSSFTPPPLLNPLLIFQLFFRFIFLSPSSSSSSSEPPVFEEKPTDVSIGLGQSKVIICRASTSYTVPEIRWNRILTGITSTGLAIGGWFMMEVSCWLGCCYWMELTLMKLLILFSFFLFSFSTFLSSPPQPHREGRTSGAHRHRGAAASDRRARGQRRSLRVCRRSAQWSRH